MLLMLHVVESRKPLDRVTKDLEAAVARHKFGVLGVHDLRAKLAEKGVTFARECRVFEVCNPHQARKVLEASLEISTALPCRISVYEEGGITKLATIKPTAMIALYAKPELKGVAEDVETTLGRIMAEAAE
jgi:uncharacterized protein (DUF302 family)